MRRRISKADVWHHIMSGLIMLGGTLGAAEVYGEYLREQHRPAQPEPEWDWSIPHRWYDQARHPGSA